MELSTRNGKVVEVEGKFDTKDIDCYWCGKVFDKKLMKPTKIRSVKVYICPNCTPK